MTCIEIPEARAWRDRETQSRLGCPAPVPWWDDGDAATRAADGPTNDHAEELSQLEAVLAEVDGDRVRVQRLAREQLDAAGEPVTRLAVARLACRLPADDAGRNFGEGAA